MKGGEWRQSYFYFGCSVKSGFIGTRVEAGSFCDQQESVVLEVVQWW